MAVGLGSVALAAGLVACSDDTDASRRDARRGTGSATKAELRTYCAKVLEAETLPFPQVGAQTDVERTVTLTRYATDLRALLDEVVAVAPATIKADQVIAAEALRQVVDAGGDLTKRGVPEVRAAAARAHAFDLARCGWSQVNTAAVEYAFERFPDSVPAGVVSFELTNKGDFDHLLELYRVNGDTVGLGREILSGGAPTQADLAKLTDLGSAFAREAEEGYVVRDLEPGRYVAACLISLGGSPPATHASRGMLAEFAVE
ncbi:MAG: hypothetical protein ABIS21_08020 [Acidimicrobiales bacterium]